MYTPKRKKKYSYNFVTSHVRLGLNGPENSMETKDSAK